MQLKHWLREGRRKVAASGSGKTRKLCSGRETELKMMKVEKETENGEIT
jgi:hypothetical protein